MSIMWKSIPPEDAHMKHPINPNLSLTQDAVWNGLPVLSQRGYLVEHYLYRIYQVIINALAEHHRTKVFRIDLKFPAMCYEPDSRVITRFFESLKSQIRADTQRKERLYPRVHPCKMRYIWVRERNTSQIWHYHVVVFLNSDRYKVLGRYKSPEEYLRDDAPQITNQNMSDRFRKAWASALGIPLINAIGLVHFAGGNGMDISHPLFQAQLNEVFSRLSYLAKAATKHYGEGHRNFGCSLS